MIVREMLNRVGRLLRNEQITVDIEELAFFSHFADSLLWRPLMSDCKPRHPARSAILTWLMWTVICNLHIVAQGKTI